MSDEPERARKWRELWGFKAWTPELVRQVLVGVQQDYDEASRVLLWDQDGVDRAILERKVIEAWAAEMFAERGDDV